LKPIGINPGAEITVRHIDGDDYCVVVDDFLRRPGELVEFSVANSAAFEPQDIGYPGVLCDVERTAMDDIHRFIRSRMSRQFSFFKGDIRTSTYLSMATRLPAELAPLQRLPHSDPRANPERRNYAALIYLFDDPELGGTGFYRWTNRELIEQATAMEMDTAGSSANFLEEHLEMYRQPPQYMTGSNEVAELLLEIPARHNRLLFYSGDVPHSAHIPHPGRLSADFAKGRLTLNCFASVRPK
jgi:hypothetical protein